MINGLGVPQSVLLLGGTSDIAQAIAREYLQQGPMRIILAARKSAYRAATAQTLQALGARVQILDFDAMNTAEHQQVIEKASAEGDIDIAVVAFGQLGAAAELAQDPMAAAALAQVNYVAAISTGTALAAVMKHQGHGQIIALSSVAAQLPRASNVVYGSSKAGFDAYFTGLDLSLHPTGVKVLIVRPGFVRSKMTTGLTPSPLSSTPQQVAKLTVSAVRRGKHVIWSPPPLRWVITVLSQLPTPVLRRLPL